VSVSHGLDDLARALAQPTSRGRALRLGAGVLLGMALPATRWTPTARAGFCGCGTPGASAEIDCDGVKACCCPGDEPYCADNPVTAACRRKTCPKGETWCGGDLNGSVRCCKAGESCGYLGDGQHKCSCEGQRCGNSCCKNGKVCSFSSGKRVCCPGIRLVQRTYGAKPVNFCCPAGTVHTLASTRGGAMYACCPPGQLRCCDQDPTTPGWVPFRNRWFCVSGRRVKL
jgi:hypothetical protein